MADAALYELVQLTGKTEGVLARWAQVNGLTYTEIKDFYLITGRFPDLTLTDEIKKYGAEEYAKILTQNGTISS